MNRPRAATGSGASSTDDPASPSTEKVVIRARPPATRRTARGATPSYWVAAALGGKWAEAHDLSCDTAFGAVFASCRAAPAHSGLTLLQALQAGGHQEAGLGQLLAAAYLNTLSGKTVGYATASDLRQMAAGTFKPASGGAAWDQAKTAAYLRLTMASHA